MRIPKYGCHNLVSPMLRFLSIWTAFTSYCPLDWRSFCFRCVVVDLCFIHCHIPSQKILFTSLEQLQTALWILDALLFLVGCEQTRHPLRKQLTHPQIFVQNCKHIPFWYLLKVPITLIKSLLSFNSIFTIKKQCLINTRNSDLSIILKMETVASPKPL